VENSPSNIFKDARHIKTSRPTSQKSREDDFFGLYFAMFVSLNFIEYPFWL